MWDSILHTFIAVSSQKVIVGIVLASFIDILMGLIKAAIGHSFNSTISSAGILKHVALIVVPILASPLFDFIPMGATYWAAFTGLILVTMVVSVVENWISCGLPFPDSLKKYLDDKKTALVKPQNEAKEGTNTDEVKK